VIQCEVRLARLNKLIRCTPSAPSQKLRSGSSHEKARGREGVMTSNFQELILLPECAEREREERERERERERVSLITRSVSTSGTAEYLKFLFACCLRLKCGKTYQICTSNMGNKNKQV